MSNEVINQLPSVERAKELEQQVKDGLHQLKVGHDKAIIACHKMRDTKAYKALGFDSYYAWGESALHLKKSRLNELALAGEVQQELLTGVVDNVQISQLSSRSEAPIRVDNSEVISDSSVVGEDEDELIETEETEQIHVSDNSSFTVSALSEISTPQLIALAKAPKGERLSVLDKVVVEAKAEDKPITTKTIQDAVKASAPAVEYYEPSDHEKAEAVKKEHRAVMGKVSKISEALDELDTTQVASEENESWKVYLDEIKLSISTLEKQLGHGD